MSINILLNEQGTEPLRYEDEYFILKRNDISYNITLESKNQYNGEGFLILTSNRLVIIPMKQNANFRALEIPLNQIYSEEFKQPLFGKNYIKGSCRPFFQSQFGNFNFTIWLKGNRVGTLVGTFFTLLDSLRNNQGRYHNSNIMKCLKENNFNAIFAIDPEDQSFLYHIQPSSVNMQRQNFQSEIINRPKNFNNINNNINNCFNNNINTIQKQNNNYGNFSRLNEEEMKENNDVYRSHFVYKNPSEKFVYKDPGFVYKEPNNHINNAKNNINNDYNNIQISYNNINNANNINNNYYYINNNINNINNRLKKEEDDDDELVSPYDIKKKNEQNIIYNNNINQINNINNNMRQQNNINNNYSNIPPQMIIRNSQPILQNQYIKRNIQDGNNKDDMDLNNPYQIKEKNNYVNNIIFQNNLQFNQGYPIQNNYPSQNQNYNNQQNIQNMNNIQNRQINLISNKYNQIHDNLNNIDKKIPQNKETILNNNKNIGKYKQLSEEMPDESELNSKNQLTNNDFNESNINLDNKQDLSLISHKDDSLPDLSNIYPDL